MTNIIQLSHGDGGKKTQSIIREIFYKHFDNELLKESRDAAIFSINNQKLAFTTDSFVVKPLFFNGGDIGKLAVCGTVNDLAAVGAVPIYMSAAFVIEEGFEKEKLDKIAQSMGETCKKVGTKIITGDTKVVEKGCADGLYINTTGIGIVSESYTARELVHGDEIIITGTIAQHGTTILAERHGFNRDNIRSDCKPLDHIINHLGKDLRHIKCMADPTRGGLATILCEIAEQQNIGMIIDETRIPINNSVKAVHQILGTDPMYFASEGRLVLFVENGYGESICRSILQLEEYVDIIGTVCEDGKKIVRLKTCIGGTKIMSMLQNQMIPRIC